MTNAMRTITRFLTAAALAASSVILAFAPTPASAEETEAAADASYPDPAARVAEIEAYLNSVRTLKARFSQIAGDGSVLTGDFMLKRPGKMRFDYDEPVKDFIVADGTFVYYYDSAVEQQSHAPVGETLADFFLRKHLSFSEGLTVRQVGEDSESLSVTVEQKDMPEAGQMTIFFRRNPLQLERWRVLDGQGQVTEVALSDIRENVGLSSALFRYVDPKRGEERYN